MVATDHERLQNMSVRAGSATSELDGQTLGTYRQRNGLHSSHTLLKKGALVVTLTIETLY